MASAAVSPPTIDLKAQATYPIRVGNSISTPADAPLYTSIRYNHKPNLQQSNPIKASIRAGKEIGESTLSIEVDEGAYTYSGRYGGEDDSFVLVVRGRGKDKHLFLERMGSRHHFNLTSTPLERDASKLVRQYPPLQDTASEDSLLADEDEDPPPDVSNPFDFRHFLKTELETAESTNSSHETARNNAASPPAKARPTSSAPAKKGVNRTENKATPARKRKAPVAEKTNSRRSKAAPQAASTQAAPAPAVAAEAPKSKAKKPEIPKINLDRNPPIDDGELILENETPVTDKPARHPATTALALNGQFGKGPISLRSAANSPGSYVASPAPPRPEGMEEEYVFEFDDDDEEGEEDNHNINNNEEDNNAEADGGEPDEEAFDMVEDHNHDRDVDEDEEDEEDDDAEVENPELPSPQVQHRLSITNTTSSAAAAGDDDDDLDKQLALAMMEEDDGGGNQESEESEEE